MLVIWMEDEDRILSTTLLSGALTKKTLALGIQYAALRPPVSKQRVVEVTLACGEGVG